MKTVSAIVLLLLGSQAPDIAIEAMNDTGITWSGNYASGNNSSCLGGVDNDEQDCAYGLDAFSTDNDNGYAGFNFVQLDSSGNALTVKSTDYSTTPWSCVKDNTTGLIWEVKTPVGAADLHKADDVFTWYSTDASSNGGNVGTEDSAFTCYDYSSGAPVSYCNTEAYVNRVNNEGLNNEGLCGGKNWRLPTQDELLSIVSYVDGTGTVIDASFFPNTQWTAYWTSSVYVAASPPSLSRSVDFHLAETGSATRDTTYRVRLVRSVE